MREYTYFEKSKKDRYDEDGKYHIAIIGDGTLCGVDVSRWNRVIMTFSIAKRSRDLCEKCYNLWKERELSIAAMAEYQEGVIAAIGRMPMESNPYPNHSKSRKLWRQGWEYSNKLRLKRNTQLDTSEGKLRIGSQGVEQGSSRQSW